MTKHDFPPMLMEIDGGRLVPANAFVQERLDSYRRGTRVMVRFTEEKDRPMIRKWWAVIGLVIKQCETPWKTKDEASEAIKLALGLVNLSKTVSGQWMQYPKSLTELEDPELDEAVDQMIELLSRMTGVDVSTLRKEASSAGADDQTTDQPDDADGPSSPVDASGAGDSALPTESPAPNIPVLKDVFRRLFAAVGPDPQVVEDIAAGMRDEIATENALTRQKASTIKTQCKMLCLGDVDRGEMIEYLAGVIGVEPVELAEAEA